MKTYPSLARDSALPHHQIHLPIWKRLRLSHKTLEQPTITIKIRKDWERKNKIQTRRGKIMMYMRMILPPCLPLLHEPAARNACRHVSSLRTAPPWKTLRDFVFLGEGGEETWALYTQGKDAGQEASQHCISIGMVGGLYGPDLIAFYNGDQYSRLTNPMCSLLFSF